MPELPEVETTVLGLRKKILGWSILDVWTDLKTKDPRKKETVADSYYFPSFKKAVLNKKILSISRRGKNILIHLSAGKSILIHLKMTGYLFVGNNPKIDFAHVIFTLQRKKNEKKFLVFSDARKFGKMLLISTKDISNSKHLKELGPEPLKKDFSFDLFLKRLLLRPNGKIKTVLMDQKIIAGIGNIYSDEILWRASIHPERKIIQLKTKELKKIFLAIKQTLTKGISLGGDSTSDYLNVDGKPGKFQLNHQAYQKTGKKCVFKNCSGVIIRKIINNRSAHFCPQHQK